MDALNGQLWEVILNCPLCGTQTFRNVVLAQDRHYGNPGTFQVVECDSCQIWFLNPMPTLEFLATAYPEDYYSYSSLSSKRPNRLAIKRLKRFIRKLIGFTSGWTGDPTFSRPGRMLDIGCGSGTFLLQKQSEGWETFGVELSREAAERGRLAGLNIFGGTIDDAHFPSGSFDYVRSNHSFEHIHNPREVLREIHRVIKPNGKVFIGVPNVKGLMSRIFGTYWWYLGAPVHTFGYSPSTLANLLTQEGFRVIRVNYNSTFAGIFGSIQIILNRKNGRSSEDGWAYNNSAMRLLGHWIARCADFFHAGDCIEIIAEPLP